MVSPISATRSFRPAAIFAAAALALAGCNFSERIAGIGAERRFEMRTGIAPVAEKGA